MSQEQPRRPQSDQEPIKYGDVFPVAGSLADKPVAPQDAALMQSAETAVLGQTQKGGPAATMQSAATRNERAGLVGHTDITNAAGDEGVTVTETDVPGRRIITESVAGQVSLYCPIFMHNYYISVMFVELLSLFLLGSWTVCWTDACVADEPDGNGERGCDNYRWSTGSNCTNCR